MKSSEFRKVYDQGTRVSGPFFTAFLLSCQRDAESGPRLGFTVPRAFGKATRRNRAKRRIRELLRVRLGGVDPSWDVVINPRKQMLEASPVELEREVERLLKRCGKF